MLFKSVYRIIFIIILSVFVLLSVSYYRVSSILKEDLSVRLPILVGKDIIEANEILNSINENLNKKIRIRVIPVSQNNYPRYTVVKQEPHPRGISVKEGRTINLQVSVGKLSSLQIPSYINRPFSIVKEVLTRYKGGHKSEMPILGSIILKPDKNIAKGNIIAQYPLPGTIVSRNATIDFIVSDGIHKEIIIENYLGRLAEPVIKQLSDAKLLVYIKNTKSSIAEEDGKIISQDKKEGSVLKEGDSIVFSLANYHDKKADEIENYRIIRFVVPSMAHPFFKDKKDNIVDLTLTVKDDFGETIIYKGKKRFGEQLVECYKKKGKGIIEVLLDDRRFRSFSF